MRVGGFLPPDIPPHVAVDVDSACTRCLVWCRFRCDDVCTSRSPQLDEFQASGIVQVMKDRTPSSVEVDDDACMCSARGMPSSPQPPHNAVEVDDGHTLGRKLLVAIVVCQHTHTATSTHTPTLSWPHSWPQALGRRRGVPTHTHSHEYAHTNAILATLLVASSWSPSWCANTHTQPRARTHQRYLGHTLGRKLLGLINR